MKVCDRAGIELVTPGSAVRLASVARYVTDCATRPSLYFLHDEMIFMHKAKHILNRHFSCSCSDAIYSKSIKKKKSFLKVTISLIKSDEMVFLIYMFAYIDLFHLLSIFLSYIFFLLLSHQRCLSRHKLKFWTGIRQKIRCGMVLVGMDS